MKGHEMIGRMTLLRTLLVMAFIASAGLSAAPAPPGTAARETSVLDFLSARRDRQWTHVPRKVLAFYYTWYGRPDRHGRWIHWDRVDPQRHDISASTHYPARGAYDSHDPAVIDDHIDLAKSCGIDAFICTWWGRGNFEDRAFEKVLERAQAKDFHVTIYWETAPGKGQAQVDRAVSDLLYVLQRYGSHPAFLKVNGKPVIFVYGRVMGQVAIEQWPLIVTEVERRYTPGCLLVADGYGQRNARLFDGIHTYNICGWVQGKSVDELRAASRDSFAGAVQTAKRFGKISCITVIPGYNDTKIRKPGLNAQRLDGNTYRVLWEEAIRADPDWVLITSWNEWHEGSEIEPSWEDGDKYVRLTETYTKRFKATPYSAAKFAGSGAVLTADKGRELARLYSGSPVAVLPEYSSDAVFWLADAGVPLKELTWPEVASPDQFNATRFPVVLYAGGEHYRQTVRERGDVDRNLQSYLEDGGLLVVLPDGPSPFYYNEEGRTVASGRRFGLDIRGGSGDPASAPTGWESPPRGLKFAFELDDGVLQGLPRRVDFPADGDLRWRPITDRAIGPGDIYLPLARLRDSTGRVWGDGIAYVEHKASTPRGGKCIYSWMRMADIIDRNDLLYELFRLAARKAK